MASAQQNLCLISVHIDTERYAEHANKLALAVAKRFSPNVNYDAEIRREFLWLKRKLVALESLMYPDGRDLFAEDSHAYFEAGGQ